MVKNDIMRIIMMIVLISYFFCSAVGGGFLYFDVGVEWEGRLVI